MDLQITWETLLAIAGGFVLFAQAIRIIINMFNPIQEIRKEIDRFKVLMHNDKEHLEKLDDAIERVNSALSLLGLAVSDLITHELTGNGDEKLKETQKKLHEFFYNGKE